MKLSSTARTWIFFIALFVVSAMTIRHDFARFLPAALATEIGHNREALGFAILTCATIQWFRPWAARQRRGVWIAAAFGAVIYALGWLLLHSSLPSDYTTFSESFFGAGMVAWYVQPRRPLRYGPWLTLVVLLFIIIFFKTGIVLDQAEDLVMILLSPIAFDVFDRTILDRTAVDRPRLRMGWCAALVFAWLVFWRLAKVVRPDLSGPIDYGIDYAYRAAEAYWGVLLVHVYFSYWLCRSWRDRVESLPKEEVRSGVA